MTIPDQTFPLDTNLTTAAWVTSSMATRFENASFQLTWADADAGDGTAVIQGSLDDVSWSDLAKADGSSNQITITAGAGFQLWELLSVSVRYLRFKYLKGSNSAGTGTLVTFANYVEED